MPFEPLVSEVEAQQVTTEFLNRLQASHAELDSTPLNISLLIGWLQNQDMAITADNLVRASSAISQSLTWKVPPPTPKSKRGFEVIPNTGRANHAKTRFADTAGIISSREAIARAVKKYDADRERAIFASLRRDCQTYIGRTHAKSYAGRDKLLAKLDELESKRVRADEAKKQIDALRDSL